MTGDSETDTSEGPEDFGFHPDTIQRSCTDVATLVVFFVALVGLAFCTGYGLRYGQLFHNSDLCGYGTNAGRPFFFFCLSNETKSYSDLFTLDLHLNRSDVNFRGGLDFAYPLCIESCPSGSGTSHTCTPKQGPVDDYPTVPFIGMLCKPVHRNLEYQLGQWIASDKRVKVVAGLSAFVRAWQVPLAATLTAVVTSYSYIFLLRSCASVLVRAGFLILTIVPLLSAAYFLFQWYRGDTTGESFEGEAARQDNLLRGACSLLVGMCFLCIVLRFSDSVDLAVDCLEQSCECVMATPGLRFVPLISFCCRAVLLAAQVATVLLLLSTASSEEVVGNWFLLAPTPAQWAMAAYVGAVYFWAHQVSNSITDFVTVYAAEVWYFNHESGTPVCIVWKAYWQAVRFHLGTLALGGLCLAVTSPLRCVLAPMESLARTAHTPVGMSIRAVCCCCVQFFDSFLAFLSITAYMDVAMHAKGFCRAARDAERLRKGEAETVQILNGVTWLFQLFGLLSIGLLAHTLSLALVDVLNSNPQSDRFVHNPEVFSLSVSALAAVASLPLFLIFDTVSDTIIYCYSVRKKRLAAIEKRDLQEGHWFCTGRGWYPCLGKPGSGSQAHYWVWDTAAEENPVMEAQPLKRVWPE